MQYSPLAGAGQRPSQSVSLPKECPVDISQDYLRYWRAGVPRGRCPMASLGTAQRLAPVHSGLPLCETCLSSAATAKTSSMILPAASSRIKSGWWWWFCGVGKDCGGNPDYSPLQSIPAFWNRLFTHHSGAKYRTILCRIWHTILFWHSSPHFLLHCF